MAATDAADTRSATNCEAEKAALRPPRMASGVQADCFASFIGHQPPLPIGGVSSLIHIRLVRAACAIAGVIILYADEFGARWWPFASGADRSPTLFMPT